MSLRSAEFCLFLIKNRRRGFPSEWTVGSRRVGRYNCLSGMAHLSKNGIVLERRHSWRISTGPEFSTKAADIIGLYLSPPEGALVICVNEKPATQALERAQGYLR